MYFHIVWFFITIAGRVVGSELLPGDQTPGDYVIPTLDGNYTFWESNSTLIIQGYDPNDAFCDFMWRSQDSLDSIWNNTPPGTAYLFISHSGDALQQAKYLRSRLHSGDPPSQGNTLNPSIQLHFATLSTEELSGWLPSLFRAWKSPRKRIEVAVHEQSLSTTPIASQHTQQPHSASLHSQEREQQTWNTTRLDAAYGWIPWPMTVVTGSLVLAGNGCDWYEGAGDQRMHGSIALIPLLHFPDLSLTDSRYPNEGLNRKCCSDKDDRAQRNNRFLLNQQSFEKIPTITTTVEATAAGDLPTPCRVPSYADLLLKLQQAGAIACIFAAPEGEDIDLVDCRNQEECNTPIVIPVTMVSYGTGQRLETALRNGASVRVNFTEIQDLGLNFGVDKVGQLFEVGWLKFPSLQHAAWAAQWQAYLDTLHTTVQASALSIPILQDEKMEGEHGVRVNVTLPLMHTMLRYDTVMLNMELNCLGPKDQDCPVWDHIIQLFTCCTDPGTPLPPSCDPCPTTVWTTHSLRNTVHTDQNRGMEEGVEESLEGLRCGRELARWATPFRRRGGRWLTNITDLLPLLSGGQQCTFTMQSTAWAGTWVPSLSLEFFQENEAGGKIEDVLANKDVGIVFRVLPLPFAGGRFDAQYNQQHASYTFHTPQNLYKALLVSYITGHGSDEFGCAEFCPTSHTFEVNGQRHTTRFDAAGTPWGCADQVLTGGVLPNEHGTWQYGRNGWCDGQAVQPWVVDITADLLVPPEQFHRSSHTATAAAAAAAAGDDHSTLYNVFHVQGSLKDTEANKAINTITYYGLFKGKDPNPEDQPGEIMMQSNVILYYYQEPLS